MKISIKKGTPEETRQGMNKKNVSGSFGRTNFQFRSPFMLEIDKKNLNVAYYLHFQLANCCFLGGICETPLF